MPEIQKHLSKGIRRHIRYEKARKKKEAGFKIQTTNKLPNYYDFPKAIREEKGNRFQGYVTKYFCPNCKSSQYKDATIQTIQGVKTIYICQSCQNKFILKRK